MMNQNNRHDLSLIYSNDTIISSSPLDGYIDDMKEQRRNSEKCNYFSPNLPKNKVSRKD